LISVVMGDEEGDVQRASASYSEHCALFQSVDERAKLLPALDASISKSRPQYELQYQTQLQMYDVLAGPMLDQYRTFSQIVKDSQAVGQYEPSLLLSNLAAGVPGLSDEEKNVQRLQHLHVRAKRMPEGLF